MLIQTRNNLTDNVPQTFLSVDVAAGVSVLGWKNPNGFNANWAVQVGKTGEEQTEILLLGASTPAGTAGTTTGNTLYSHPANTPIYAIKYDQIVFEVSTSGTTGVAIPITNGTQGIQADNEYTQFDDTVSGTASAWRTYFKNSVSAVTSTESDWITLNTVPAFYSLANIRQRIKDRMVSPDFIKDDLVIDNWINEWLEQMNNAAVSVNEGYSMGTAEIAFANGNTSLGTLTQTDFKQLERAWWKDTSGTYLMTKMDNNSFGPQTQFTQTAPCFSLLDDNVIEVRPENPTGTVQIVYNKLPARLINDTDNLPVIMRGYTKSFVDYGLGQAYWKDSKQELAQPKEQLAIAQLENFKSQIAPSVRTGPTSVQIVEGVGDDSPWWV